MDFFLIRATEIEFGEHSSSAGDITRVSAPTMVNISPVVSTEAAEDFCTALKKYLSKSRFTENKSINFSGCMQVTMTVRDERTSIGSEFSLSWDPFSLTNMSSASVLERLVSAFGEEHVRITVEVSELLRGKGGKSFCFIMKDLMIKEVNNPDGHNYVCESGSVILPHTVYEYWSECTLVYATFSVIASLDDSVVSKLYSVVRKSLGFQSVDSICNTKALIISKDGQIRATPQDALAHCSEAYREMVRTTDPNDLSSLCFNMDVSGEAFDHVIEFLENRDITKPSGSFEACFRLYKAANTMRMRELTAALTHIICAKPAGWFDIDTTFKLLTYLNQADLSKTNKDLSNRAIEICKLQSKEHPDAVHSSDAFNSLFKMNTDAGKSIMLHFLRVAEVPK